MAEEEGNQRTTETREEASTSDLQMFFRAAFNEDIEEIKRLLKEKAIDINLNNPERSPDILYSKTALHIACKSENLNLVKFLIENGADVNKKDHRGKHALHISVSTGNLEVTQHLIKEGSDINLVDKYGRSPLHWAAYNSHVNIVHELLNNGAQLWCRQSGNWQPIHESVKVGSKEVTQVLIDKGSPVNNEIQAHKIEPFAPLHIAAREGHLDCVELLLKHGAKVNCVNAGRHTPLHIAAHKGATDVVHMLLLQGADANIENNLCRTALHEACSRGNLKCAILLLDAGCDVNHTDNHCETALMHVLHHACDVLFGNIIEDTIVLCDLLLQYGSSPLLSGNEGQTALSLAASLANRSLQNMIHNALEHPPSLMNLCKIKVRLQAGCSYHKIDSLHIPVDLQNYLLQNSKYYSCI